ncbi:MAG: hypothetical protein RR330_05505 [Alistipes sp.]
MGQVITRGQITIVDLNDGKSINLFLGSNQPATQIFNKENSTYQPSYTAAPYLVITPEVYVSGVSTNQTSRLKGVPVWKINGSTTLSTYGATAATTAPYALTIKSNLSSVTALTIECTVIYVDPDNTAETVAKAAYTITKVENTGQQIRAIAYTPNGSVFKNGIVSSLTAHCDLWRGSVIDETNVTYAWEKLINGIWTAITSANASGVTGYTTDTITIPAGAVLNFESFKCSCKDTDTASGTYNTSVSDLITIADMTDPYTVEISAPAGTTLTAGLTSTVLTVNCWQNGALLADSWFTGATCTWRKYSKAGAADTAWGTAGVKTGRTLTITRDEISVAATFTVDISK